MQKVLYFLTGCLFILLCLTTAVSAQDLSSGPVASPEIASGEIVGSVVDPKGVRVPGATIVISGDKNFEQHVMTGAEGKYWVKLPAGHYRLEVLIGDTKKSKPQEAEVTSNKTTRMDLPVETEVVAETAEQQRKAKASLISAGLTLWLFLCGIIFFWVLRKRGLIRLSLEGMPIKRTGDGQLTELAGLHLSGSMAVFHCTTYAFVYGFFMYIALTLFNFYLENRSVSTEELNSLGLFSNWLVSDPINWYQKAGVLIFLLIPPLLMALVSKIAVDFVTLKILEMYSLNTTPEQKALERVESTVSELHRGIIEDKKEQRSAIASLEGALGALENIVPRKPNSKTGTIIPLIISSDSHLVDLSKGVRPTALVIVAQRIWYYNNWYGIGGHDYYFPPGNQDETAEDKEIREELDRILKKAISTCVANMRKNYKQLFSIDMKTKYATHPRSIRLIFGSVKHLVDSATHIDRILGSEALYPVPAETTKEIQKGAQGITDTADEIAPKAETLEHLFKDAHDKVHEKTAKDAKEGIEKMGDEGENIKKLTHVIETREEGILNIWISEPIGRRMKVEQWAAGGDDKELFDSVESSSNLKSLLPAYWRSLGKSPDPGLFDDVKRFGDNWPDHDFLAVGGLLYQPGYLDPPTTNVNAALRGFIGLLPIVLMALNFKHVLPFQETTHAIAEGSENHAYYETLITDFQTKGTVADAYAKQ